jgi:hypothetical protein
MGLIILDEIETPVGLKLSGLIVTVKGGFHLMPRETNKGKIYELYAKLYYYVSRDYLPLYEEPLKLRLSPEQIRDPYVIIYDYLRKKYPKNREC